MQPLNVLFTLSSFVTLTIIIERLLPLTRVLLQPSNFIRLHEINQTVIFLPISVLISVLTLKVLTNNFQTLKAKESLIPLLCFIVGAYLFGAGEGWHEVASFTLNQYCTVTHPVGVLCHGLFINDFYAGNIIFFVGGVMMNGALLVFALRQPSKLFTKSDIALLLFNSVVYAFTWFAYAAFDTVLVGLFFSAVLMVISLGFFTKIKERVREYPYILYSAVAYTLATIATLIVRFLH